MTGAYAPVFCFLYNSAMRWTRIVGNILLVLAALGLFFSLWPASIQTTKIPFMTPDGLAGTLSLSQASQLHVGDNTEIKLNIVIDQKTTANNELSFISKLELNNLEVNPKGEGKVTVDPTKPVVLIWDVTSPKTGSFSGTLWLFIESTKGEKELILARPLKFVVNNFIGFSYQSARVFCIISMIAGLFLIFFPMINTKPLR